MDGASRTTWTATQKGTTLLVVRDRVGRGLHFWWRVRDADGRNLAKGNASSANDGTRRARKAFREFSHEKVDTSKDAANLPLSPPGDTTQTGKATKQPGKNKVTNSMSIFSQLAGASSTEGRNPFINRQGVTIDKVVRIRAGKTQQGEDFFAADLEVESIISEQGLSSNVQAVNEKLDADKRVPEGANQPGERVTFYVKLANPYIDNKLGNVKNFVEALCDAMGMDPPGSAGEWEEAIMDKEAGLASGDGTLAAGTRLIRSSEARANKARSGIYVVSTFAPAEDAAE
jgi:hypothetical protein